MLKSVNALWEMKQNPGTKFICQNHVFDYEEIRREGMLSFVKRNLSRPNVVLYKYFPNTIKEDSKKQKHNYSLDAFLNNEVYLSDPDTFDDSNKGFTAN